MLKTISPARRISGQISLPGDKSISHRALLISAIAEGKSVIENLSHGRDVRSTMQCLTKLGVTVEEQKHQTIVHGKGLISFKRPSDMLDVGNSGTTIRLLSGLLAGHPHRFHITGDESIRARPMSRIVAPLRKMGAKVEAVKEEYAPLLIEGGKLKAIDYELPVASAQVKSCILLAGLYAEGRTHVNEPSVTRDHTELMLSKFGASVQKEGNLISVDGPANLQAQELYVPGDLSSGAFFIAAATLLPESEVLIRNVGINPTRKAFLSLLCDLGANIQLLNIRNVGNELMADVFARSSKLTGVRLDGKLVPQIIDEIPILAVMASQATGKTEIKDARELRFKESDRLRSIVFNLERMGVPARETEDGLIIEGPAKLQAAELESFNDHRIAMAFAVAALVSDGECQMKEAQCAEISYPDYYQTLEEISVA